MPFILTADAVPGMASWSSSTIGSAQPNILWVNNNITPPLDSPTGSIDSPYASIQDALDHAGEPVDLLDQVFTWVIYIASGIYDEDLVIPPYRSIGFIPQGIVLLGASGPERTITIDLSTAPTGYSPNPTKFTIYGIQAEHYGMFFDDLVLINTTNDNRLDVTLEGVALQGNTSPAIDGTGLTGAGGLVCNLYLRECDLESQDPGDAGIPVVAGPAATTSNEEFNLVLCRDVEFVSEAATNKVAITAVSYSLFDRCLFEGDVTFIGNPAGQGAIDSRAPSQGFLGCDFASPGYTWTGIAAQADLWMDAASNYRFRNSGWTAAPGGAGQKTILNDTVP